MHPTALVFSMFVPTTMDRHIYLNLRFYCILNDKMRKLLALTVLVCRAAFPQVPAQAVNQTMGAPPFGVIQLFAYSGSNVIWICNAASNAPQTVFSIGGAPAFTNIVVASNIATINFATTAQLWLGMQVTVAGSTTAALNGAYKITGPAYSSTSGVSGTTATFTTSGVSDGTYNSGATTITTKQPLLNALRWSIEIFTYSGSNVTGIYWAGNPSIGSTIAQNLACSSGATY